MTDISHHPSSAVGVWLVAVRPFAYAASVLPVLLGLGLVYYSGHAIRWGLFGVTLLGVFCFHTGANLLNDVYDYRRGLDRVVLPTSGAIVRGWLAPGRVLRVAVGFLVLGGACGALLTWLTGWPVLALALLGGLAALGYTRSGVCLKCLGLGDAGIFLAFGVLPPFGTWWVQAERFSLAPFLWGAAPGMLTVAILHANNWRDMETDAARGCRTPAVRLGPRRSALYYRALVVMPFALVLLLAGAGLAGLQVRAPLTTLCVFLSLPVAWRLLRVDAEGDGPTISMLDAKTARLQILFGLLLVAAFFVGRHTG